MTPELAATVAEVEREWRAAARTVVAGPSPVQLPGSPSVVTTYEGDFVGYLCRACGGVVDQVRGGRCAYCEAAGAVVRPVAEDDADAGRSRGICGAPGCRTRIDRPRGLCGPHRDRIRSIMDRPEPTAKKKYATTRRDPNGPDALGRLPMNIRAERIVRAARERGRLTRQEAAAAAGLTSTEGSLPRILRFASERGWLVVQRGPEGGVLPGEIAP